jgi:hypothetical protein
MQTTARPSRFSTITASSLRTHHLEISSTFDYEILAYPGNRSVFGSDKSSGTIMIHAGMMRVLGTRKTRLLRRDSDYGLINEPMPLKTVLGS